ncbi:hypothetical protein [Phenylobacterium sp. 58.2.17]|uniref:hypothetical protein n=1 Tax=Phenylobacterium sp. 58.2.17 TaxID=2969306 RepID=UPI00226552EB|nr:hypothetical protein [Phenylobacterium sp. 58.2.17]MCX7585046.1 hypothetical protein [Phenylobacterium sp. 58.2.17]
MVLAYALDERRPPLQDWNGKLHVVNGSPLSKPFPRDRNFWIVTAEDALAVEVAYSDEYMLWTRRETYVRLDGETGAWEPDEIAGWTDSYEDACQAAVMLSLLLMTGAAA